MRNRIVLLGFIAFASGTLGAGAQEQSSTALKNTDWVPIAQFGALIQNFKNTIRMPLSIECKHDSAGGETPISVRFAIQDNKVLRIRWRAAWGKRMDDFDKVLSGQGYVMTSRTDVKQPSGDTLSCALWHK